MKDSSFEYFEISRLVTILENYLLFITLAVSNSVVTDSPLSDKFVLPLAMAS